MSELKNIYYHVDINDVEFEEIEPGFLYCELDDERYAAPYEKKPEAKFILKGFFVSLGKEKLESVDKNWLHCHYAEESILVLEGELHMAISAAADASSVEFITYKPGEIVAIPFAEPRREYFVADSETGYFSALVIYVGDVSDARPMLWKDYHDSHDGTKIL